MVKRAQASLFVILGVVIIVVLIFVFSFGSDEKKNDLDEVVEGGKISSLSVSNVDDYVAECLNEVTKTGVFYLANNGGYIYSYSDIVLAEHEQTAFHLRAGKSTSPTDEFMEGELNRFIRNSLFLCVAEMDSLDYNLTFSYAEVETNIRLNKIEIEVDFPVTLSKAGLEKSVSDFSFELDVRLGHILDIKDDILTNRDVFIDFKELTDYDVEVNFMPFNKEVMIYSLYDNLSNVDGVPFIFNFAVEEEGNSAPKLDFVPDFVMGLDDVFIYNLSARDIDGDNLLFYSDDTELSIFSDGEVYFKPTHERDYVFDVCVRDTVGMSDCTEVKFMVEEDDY